MSQRTLLTPRPIEQYPPEERIEQPQGSCRSSTDNAYLWRRNVVRQLDSVADLAYRSQLGDNTLTDRSLTILRVRGLGGLVYTEIRSLAWRNLVCDSFLKHYRVELHLDLVFSLESTHEVSLTAT